LAAGVKVEIWSDVVCPWCYVGKRRFEAALARFPHRDEVEVVWRAFELDPAAPAERTGDYTARLAEKYGVEHAQAAAMVDGMTRAAAADGLRFRFDIARTGNTFDAHRVVHLALDRGRQDAVKERFFRGYLTEGEPIGDRPTASRPRSARTSAPRSGSASRPCRSSSSTARSASRAPSRSTCCSRPWSRGGRGRVRCTSWPAAATPARATPAPSDRLRTQR
jgi:hypothetical protein